MIFDKEVKQGMISIFHFKCVQCDVTKLVYSSKQDSPINVNEAAVLTVTSVGLGSYHLEEICSNLEIPCMSNYMYDNIQKKQQSDWWELGEIIFDNLFSLQKNIILSKK